jgi:hypothetical protein
MLVVCQVSKTPMLLASPIQPSDGKGCNSADDFIPGCRNSRNAQRLILIPIDQALRKAIMSSSTLPAVTTTAPLERLNILRNLAFLCYTYFPYYHSVDPSMPLNKCA